VLIGFWLGIALFLIVDVVWLKENFCIYICPYSRVQSVMYDDDTIMAIYDVKRGGHIYDHEGQDSKKLVHSVKELRAREPESECTACESCVKVCPTHIDIRQGMQLECINCLECVDACTKVMGALGKESLVRWTSPREIETGEKTKYIRPRTIAYAVALTIVFVALLIMGTKKEHMLLNINKTAQLYRFTHDGKVVNDYTFLFQNTDSKDHRYYFKIEGHPEIKILKPTKDFRLAAGKKAKKIVTLWATQPLAKDTRKDTPVPIKIKAFAVDDPEKIVVERNTVFVYPRWDIVQKKLKKAE
jgi:cytochrome c oxidase accessory protein FixG